jgi:hypothetical protein
MFVCARFPASGNGPAVAMSTAHTCVAPTCWLMHCMERPKWENWTVIPSKCYSPIPCLIPKANPKHMDLPHVPYRPMCYISPLHRFVTYSIRPVQNRIIVTVAVPLALFTQIKPSRSLVRLKEERDLRSNEFNSCFVCVLEVAHTSIQLSQLDILIVRREHRVKRRGEYLVLKGTRERRSERIIWGRDSQCTCSLRLLSLMWRAGWGMTRIGKNNKWIEMSREMSVVSLRRQWECVLEKCEKHF